MGAVRVRGVRFDADRIAASSFSRGRAVDEARVGGARGHLKSGGIAVAPGSHQYIDGIVVDHYRRDDESGTAIPFAFGKQARVDDDLSLDAFDAATRNRTRQFPDDAERSPSRPWLSGPP